MLGGKPALNILRFWVPFGATQRLPRLWVDLRQFTQAHIMSLPPQLIGIKRRRHDEPVDVLCKDLACVHIVIANRRI